MKGENSDGGLSLVEKVRTRAKGRAGLRCDEQAGPDSETEMAGQVSKLAVGAIFNSGVIRWDLEGLRSARLVPDQEKDMGA